MAGGLPLRYGFCMEAFVFDFDGVVVDSERHWVALDGTFFPSLMPDFNESHAAAMMGLNLEAGYRYLVATLGLAVPYDAYRQLLEGKVHRVYHELAQPLPGLTTLLHQLQEMRVPIGIASSSERPWIDACLDRLDLAPYFRSISTPIDVEGHAKPNPDVYLHAAASLGADPRACVAIEDSRNGIAAAKAAGMTCIAIRTDMNPQQDLSQADWQVTALADVHAIVQTL